MVEDARPEPPLWQRALDDVHARLVGADDDDRSRARAQFAAAVGAEGWARAEVVDHATIRGAIGLELPPMAWHRPIDRGDAWMTTSRDDNGLVTRAVVVFPDADLPLIRAVHGLIDPPGMPDPHLFGPISNRWRVYCVHRDWAIFVGDHLATDDAWHRVVVTVNGDVVAARAESLRRFRPELGRLTLGLATALHRERVVHRRPRLRVRRPPWLDEPDEGANGPTQ